MRKLIQLYAWGLCIYGPLYFLFLDKIKLTMPGSDSVAVFGQAGGGAAVILGLLCFEPKPSRYWLPMTVGAVIFLAGQVRSDWFGAALAFIIWGVLEKKMKPVALFFLGLATLLLLGAVFDVNLPSPSSVGAPYPLAKLLRAGFPRSIPRWRKTTPVRKIPVCTRARFPGEKIGGKLSGPIPRKTRPISLLDPATDSC